MKGGGGVERGRKQLVNVTFGSVNREIIRLGLLLPPSPPPRCVCQKGAEKIRGR